jgi:hypothetical protein
MLSTWNSSRIVQTNLESKEEIKKKWKSKVEEHLMESE